MQVYQFTNGQETYLIEACNIYTARQKLVDKGAVCSNRNAVVLGNDIPATAGEEREGLLEFYERNR